MLPNTCHTPHASTRPPELSTILPRLYSRKKPMNYPCTLEDAVPLGLRKNHAITGKKNPVTLFNPTLYLYLYLFHHLLYLLRPDWLCPQILPTCSGSCSLVVSGLSRCLWQASRCCRSPLCCARPMWLGVSFGGRYLSTKIIWCLTGWGR